MTLTVYALFLTAESDKPIFPQIGPKISDPYATVVYHTTTQATPAPEITTPEITTPETTTADPFAGTTTQTTTETPDQTDVPAEQFITGSGARRSKGSKHCLPACLHNNKTPRIHFARLPLEANQNNMLPASVFINVLLL